MNWKRFKKPLATFLSCVLALSTAAIAPITAKAEGETVDCTGGYRKAESSRIEVTEAEKTYTFTSTTNKDATFNWNSPSFVVYSENNSQLFVGRSDAYGMVDNNTNMLLPPGFDFQRFNEPADAPAWGEWLQKNKDGADCSITVHQDGNSVIVAFTNNGVSSTTTIPANGKTYVALTGENCTLSNVTENGQDDVVLQGITCNGYNIDNRTGAIEVTSEVKTYSFTSTSVGTENFHTPIVVVSQEIESGKPFDVFVVRSDLYGWLAYNTNFLPPGYQYGASFELPFLGWDSWLEDNKNGVECRITMRQDGNNAIVTLYNNGITSTATIPTSGKAYVALTGELCKLTDIKLSEGDDGGSEDDNPGNDNPGNDNPGDDNPGNDHPEDDNPKDEDNDFRLDCPTFWSAHTAGFEITAERHTYTFDSKTYAEALDLYHAPFVVVYHSGNGLVNGDGYKEYAVIRMDNWNWDTEGATAQIGQDTAVIRKATEAFPEGFDWAVWQEANRNGAKCTVTTQLYNGCALIGVSDNGLTATYAIRVDSSVKNYLSLSGDHCTLTNLKETNENHIDLSQAEVAANTSFNPPNTSTPTTPTNPAPAPAPAAPAPAAAAPAVTAIQGGEILSGTAWWTGMVVGSNHNMSGDGTWTWTIQATSLIDGYGAFSVEIYDPATNGYITTGSDMNAWTAEGFDPAKATVSGVPAELASLLEEGHTYTVTVTRSGNTFTFHYVDYTTGAEICTLTVTPGETVSNDVQIHIMAQVGTYTTGFNAGNQIATFGAGRAGGAETLSGTAWWTGMATGSNHTMSGNGTWTWTIKAVKLVDGYGAFSVEIYDPATNGYITTGSDKNAWTAEGFDPAKSSVSGVPNGSDDGLVQTAEIGSTLVEGHTYAVTVKRSGNTFTFDYVDHTTGEGICTLVITPGETVSNDVQIHVMAQVGTYLTSFNEGTLIAALGDSVPVALYVIAFIGLAAIVFGAKKRFTK